MQWFHRSHEQKPEAADEDNFSQNETEAEEEPRSIGIGGVSIQEFMDQLEEDMSASEALNQPVSSAERLELITDRDFPGAALLPEDEVRQQLILSSRGGVVFRSVRYYRGKGHYGIGRYEERHVASSTVKEIFSLLDTWLFVQKPQLWDPETDHGSWIIRAGFAEGNTQMERGSLTGAVVDGIDLSDFIRQRIPIGGLFLFDP